MEVPCCRDRTVPPPLSDETIYTRPLTNRSHLRSCSSIGRTTGSYRWKYLRTSECSVDTQFGNAAHQVAATVACISIRRSLLAVAEKSCRSILFIDLKYAIESVMPCSALSSCMVWWTGKVSSERRDGMIVSLYKGKGSKAQRQSVAAVAKCRFFRHQARRLQTFLSVTSKLHVYYLLRRMV